jgi:hypothetical protein
MSAPDKVFPIPLFQKKDTKGAIRIRIEENNNII